MKCQKILALVTLITAALTAVLALFFCSGVISASMYYTSEYSNVIKMSVTDELGTVNDNLINADPLFEFTQSANNVLLIMAIVFILLVAFIYITNCNKRRNYYVTNYVAIGILVVYMVAFVITAFVIIGKTLALANDINFDLWRQFYDIKTVNKQTGAETHANPDYYSESRATCILGIILFVVVLAEAAAWVLNAIWKTRLMQGEKALLQATLSEEVA